jgi:hypothetical protein
MANFGERYQMISRLGAGGMGEVWLAHDEQLGNRPVAIKIMRTQLAPGGEDAARFDREMRLAAQMQHSNIVTLFTTGTFNGTPYMVMEYLEGHDLSKTPPTAGLDQIVRIGQETCSALAYAHERNVIHRDIKPGNLFLCDSGQTKVTDFGIAKAMSGTKLSSSGVLVGTFAYMSPEQWLGEPAAFSNDIWATGCSLYEFLSGRVPRECTTAGEYAAAAVRREPIPDLRSVANVPDWLSGAVMAMLHPDPRSRPAATDCVHLLSGAPSGAWQPAPVPVASSGPAPTAAAAPWSPGTTQSSLPGMATPAPVQLNEGTPGWGNRPTPPRRKRRGRVIAILAGAVVLVLAGMYAGRDLLSATPKTNSASGGSGTRATQGSHARTVSGTAAATASGSLTAGSPSPTLGTSNAAGAIGNNSTPAAGTATLTGVTTGVDVGAAPSFTYAAHDVGSGDSLVLQRTFGQTYADVTTLTGASGPVTAPKLDAMGKYSFRLAIESNGTVVAASAPVAVEAYATVQLVPFNDGSGTVQVGNRLFSYTDSRDAATYPQYEQNQAWTASTCRSITMQFTQDQSGQANGAIAYLEFVQTSSDPAYASAQAGTVKSVTVALDGGPLYINTSSTNGNTIVFTATGSCYTPSGVPQS